MNAIFLAIFISVIVSYVSAIDLTACNTCVNSATSFCVLLPAPGDPEPCYQGTNANAQTCFNTDPFILAASYTWTCGLCQNFKDGRGQYYSVYEQNDPVYVNMGLWDANPEPNITATRNWKTRKFGKK